ncbi:hypothetical protein IHQ68_13910 [Chelatococcus sambhunathii]|uniref:Uncharacterized protein n=1 Tax=Chelatococcus sambhunathii TaxID=363953 RepID=A0ABU1DI97_9HYPH|nr:hypothetical protein [Chelatococcus sambhunathii]MDR4307714.1 hypothetical protein [Chelatococcus sambhunathii]
MNLLAVVGAMLWLASAAGASADPRSTYTEHRYATCPEGKSPEPGIVEVRRCSGPGGLAVTWMGDADSAVITFGRSPLTESVDLAEFYEPTNRIEWRGASAADPAPVSAIVRYRVGRSVGALKETRLVVYRIEPSGRSCVMAVLREPGANQRARDVVDAKAATFRCGSRRIIE